MSQANRDGKKTARERVAAERLRQQQAARRRKQVTISAVTVGVIGVAAVVGLLVSMNKTKAAPLAAPVAAVVDPAIKSKDTLGIQVGSLNAPVTISVLEDFRCPVCKMAEGAVEATYKQYVADGKVQMIYHPVELIDSNSGGTGSLKGGNAAACAQDVGQFMPMHDLLYTNQPDEKTDGYGNNGVILALANQVPALKGNAAFTACVNAGTHNGFVQANWNQFNAIGAQGTPTFYIDGTQFTLPSTTGMTTQDQVNKAWADGLKAALDKEFAAKGGKAGTPYTYPADAPTTAATSAGATPSASAGATTAPSGTPTATGTAPSSSATTTKS